GSLDYAVSLDGSPLSSWRSHEEPGHSASFDSDEKYAPSKPGIKHLGAREMPHVEEMAGETVTVTHPHFA
ncbi:hypothetical protein, partial [Mesorhizobium sp. L2C067A000]|uniref:hypothetical protein n=1 Tax=Mesorhizobium sp. L2C067A000 TaxID=1287106 RepID=UPI001AEC618E